MLSQAEHQKKHMMVIKGKRTKRPRPASPLTPLITMSTSSSCLDKTGATRLATSSSSATTNADDLCNMSPGSTITTTTQEEEDMAYCLILLAQGSTTKLENYPSQQQQQQQNPGVALAYECKTCNRSFPSFQALGGHRASHKKLKTMTSQQQPEPEHHQSVHRNTIITSFQGAVVGLSLQMACNSSNTLSRGINFSPNNDNTNKSKVHACGFCGAEFSSGQALGGHMRRHRTLIAAGSSTTTPAASSHEPPPRGLQLCLDLNLPAEEEEQLQQQDPQTTPNFFFGSNDNVFTPASLVDCRY